MSLRLALSIAALLGAGSACAQSWQAQASNTSAELRGLSVVSSKIAWASGTKGTVLRTTDGAHWQAMQVPGADKIDFRDIQAFDTDTAVAMGAGPGEASRLYRTVDGGGTWTPIATNAYADGFWDGMAFWDKNNGILFGDPVKGRFQVYTTADGGVTWRAATTPIPAGAAAKGVFSSAFANPKEGIAVGGDYKDKLLDGVNGAVTLDGGATWTAAKVQPAGYMSVVVPVPGAAKTYVAAGLAGSGVTRDGGKRWTVLDRTPVNTVGFADAANGWAVGPKGLLMRYAGERLDAGHP